MDILTTVFCEGAIFDGLDDHPVMVQYPSRCTIYDRVLEPIPCALVAWWVSPYEVMIMLVGLPHSLNAVASSSKLRLHGPDSSPAPHNLCCFRNQEVVKQDVGRQPSHVICLLVHFEARKTCVSIQTSCFTMAKIGMQQAVQSHASQHNALLLQFNIRC